MQNSVSKTFHPEQIDNEYLDNLLTQIEGLSDQDQIKNELLGEFAGTEDIGSQKISRNKRAVIERLMALWVVESKSKSHTGRIEVERA